MRVVSFSLVVPYVGIPHAGGELYLRHLTVLEELGHSVTVVAPSTELNRRAADRPGAPPSLILVHPDRMRPSADAIWALARPDAIRPSMRRAFRADTAVRDAVDAADVVEAQWAEMAFALGSRHRTQGSVLVVHDIPAQREWRWLQAAWRQRSPRKLIWRSWRTAVVSVTQIPALRAADITLVLSEKDAALAARSTRASRISVIDPVIWLGSDESAREDVAKVALFVASFGRRENAEAAVWLLDDVWPLVRAEHPDAELVLAGHGPPRHLVDLAARTPGVTVTGFVDSLDPYYASARVVLVPLRSGAGVKLKTIEALVRGKRIVATSIGAEGVIDVTGSHPFAVVDDARRFARETALALRTPGGADPLITEWARARYGREQYRAALERTLSTIIAGRPPGDRIRGDSVSR
ncbi:glycosyltransferase [Microbacterium sp. ASV49]|uniref:Glycosyltransferase n=1 Tax=Microbacterium candidum TaxID=3041922 RepID=A0ABT7MUY8_9MICO|nr:glycosyltransferase [Microbacterium sp. ASV49]MDL9978262.1 glycosyltransferase [Microbacterium sp. ASV49]